MSHDPLLSLIYGLVWGVGLGICVTLGLAHLLGWFRRELIIRPEFNIAVTPFTDGHKIDMAKTADQVVVIRPYVTIDWHVLSQAAAANGWAVVPREFVRPPS